MRGVPTWIGWIAFGALLEIGLFFSALPQDSTAPTTPWQIFAGRLLTPAGAVLGALAIFGRGLDHVPKIQTVVFLMMFAAAFLAEAAILALPFWLVARFTLRRPRRI